MSDKNDSNNDKSGLTRRQFMNATALAGLAGTTGLGAGLIPDAHAKG